VGTGASNQTFNAEELVKNDGGGRKACDRCNR
jgi:hypothetical protein